MQATLLSADLHDRGGSAMARSEMNLSKLSCEPVEHRLYLATDPNSSSDVLRQLSTDPFWFVRDRVATNTSTPEDCLQALLLDPDFRVQAEAQKTLTKLKEGHSPATKPGLDAQIAAAVTRTSPQRSAPSPETAHDR